MVLIIINTIVLALDHHGMPEKMELELEILGELLALCFFLEALLKIGALGLKKYCDDKSNLFDGFIVITSIVEFFGSGGGLGRWRRLTTVSLTFFLKR